MKNEPETERWIEAGRLPLTQQLRELTEYRELIVTMAKKNFAIRYKQTVLGAAWAFLRPLITALVLVLAFGRILRLPSDGLPGLLFYLCNTAVWSFFAETVRVNAKTFLSNAALFGKVYFPRLVMPLSDLLFDLVTFGIQILMVLLFLAVYLLRGEVHVSPLWWPLLIPLSLQIGLLGMSTGIIVSSLTTRYRDLVMLVEFAIQLWMYLTPVVYPLSNIENGAMRILLLLNPMTMPMECFRRILLGKGTLSGPGIVWSAAFTVLAAAAALRLFTRVERTFMDTV